MKLMKNQRGFSVVVAAVLLSMLSIYAAVGNQLVSERAESVGQVQQSEQALYIAESGLKIALVQLEQNWGSWNDPSAFPAQDFSGGSFDTTVYQSGTAPIPYYANVEADPEILASAEAARAAAEAAAAQAAEAEAQAAAGIDGAADDSAASPDLSAASFAAMGDSSQIYKIVNANASADSDLSLSLSSGLSKGSGHGNNNHDDDDNDDHHGDDGDDRHGDDGDDDRHGDDCRDNDRSVLLGLFTDPRNSNKILICHFGRDEADERHTISISRNALSGHENHHGDLDGPCPDVFADPAPSPAPVVDPIPDPEPSPTPVVDPIPDPAPSPAPVVMRDPEELEVLVQGLKGSANRYIKATVSKFSEAFHKAIYSTGMVYIQGDGNTVVSGGVVDYAQSFPGINIAEARHIAQSNRENGFTNRADGNYFTADEVMLLQNMTSLNGVIFIDAGSDGAMANVSLSNLSTLDAEPCLLIVRGNLHLTNVHFSGLIVAAEGSYVNISGSTVNGAIIAQQPVMAYMSSTITYNAYTAISEEAQIALNNMVQPTVVTWKEYFN